MSSKIRQILKKYLQKMAKKGHEKATKKTKILIPIHSMREEEQIVIHFYQCVLQTTFLWYWILFEANIPIA